MEIKLFLSATKEDLDADCRPYAIAAVRMASDREPITMETWDTDYQNAVNLCRQKVNECGHYVGIFAYRRGWVPDKLSKSITEAEFDWANEFGKQMAVFVPDPKADFARELERRAKGQSDADSQAQESFLRRVREKAYQPFDGPNNLSLRIARRVWIWSKEGFRGLARLASLRPARQPTEDEINRLVRKELLTEFNDDLGIITRPGNAKAACFIIHGPPTGGHKQILARLRKELETNSQPRQYRVSLGPLWRQNTPGRLVDIIGLTIEQGWAPASIDALRERFKTILDETDVVLEIQGVNRLDGKLATFVKEFWEPLASVLESSVPHRLIALVGFEDTLHTEWEELVQPALKEEALTFDATRPIKLPETHDFTATEVMIWLLNGGWINSKYAQDVAEALIDETKGVPQLLYSKLAEDGTWILSEEI